MQKEVKLINWQKLEFQIKEIPGIEEKVIEIVTGLNILEISTVQSCQGHLEHGISSPWVDIGKRDKFLRELKDEYLKLNREFLENLERYTREEIKEKRKYLNNIQNKLQKPSRKMSLKLISLLDVFYKDRECNFDKKLICDEYLPNCRIISQGWFLQNIRTEKVREKYLEVYQKEIGDFGKFLKDYYFNH